MKNFVLINAIVFLLYGLGFMFFPESLSHFVTDTIPASKSGLIDMRATYGGMSVGFAILLIYMTRTRATLRLGVMAANIMVGGMAIGRTIGIVLDGSASQLMYIYLLFEVIAVIIGWRILSKTNRPKE